MVYRSVSPQGLIRRLTGACLDLLFPPICAGCATPGYSFCPRCAQRVRPVPTTICRHCGRVQRVALDRCLACAGASPLRLARAAALYRTPLREAIHALKYENRPELAGPLARYLVVAYGNDPWQALPAALDAVVPVPLHAVRFAERGYNQSELLAQDFCRQVGLPLCPQWIVRSRFTRQQVGLSAVERSANVAGAFVADAAVRNRSLLLIDDVYTTGATLHACAEAAVRAGAHAVCALALAIPAGFAG